MSVNKRVGTRRIVSVIAALAAPALLGLAGCGGGKNQVLDAITASPIPTPAPTPTPLYPYPTPNPTPTPTPRA